MGVLVCVLLGVASGLLAQGSPSRVRAGELEKKGSSQWSSLLNYLSIALALFRSRSV